MTRYLVWPDQSSALSGASVIDANYLSFLVAGGDAARDPQGGVIGESLSNNAVVPSAAKTLNWFIPKQTLLGTWVILHPENWVRQNLQFVTACLNGCTGYTVLTDPADGTWWPAPQTKGP